MQNEASDACLSAGISQEDVEDCLVCCRPNVVHGKIEGAGDVGVRAVLEQDDK